MAQRKLLRSQLCSAWKQTISGPYDSRLINSERGLQFHFCAALNQEFESEGLPRYLLVEPTVSFDGELRSPDLMICNSQKVIGVVEFKYSPRSRPSATKDFDTLKQLRVTAGKIEITNNRYRGASKPRSYNVAANAVFCWAAVYSSLKPMAVPAADIDAIGEGFLRLNALTRDKGPAVIVEG